MKKQILSFILVSLMCTFVYAQGTVTKLAQKYESDNPTLFWCKLGTEHPEIKAMKKAMDARKPAMQIVAQGLGDISSYREKARLASLSNSKYDKYLKLFNEVTRIRSVYSKVEFFIINNDEVNASMYPEGTCVINTGLIEKNNCVEEAIAVVAHEIAHYVLWHTVNDFWRTAKAVRRNQTWAQIGTGVAMGAYAASQINNAQYGVQQSQEAQQQMYNNLASAGLRIKEELGIRTNIYTRLRYMRETEEEADETAFWFLEKNGIDPIYLINFFKRLDRDTPVELKNKRNMKYSSHPDMATRIQKIEDLYMKYHNSNMKENILISQFKKNLIELNDNNYYLDKWGILHQQADCKSLVQIIEYHKITLEQLTEMPRICDCISDKTIKKKIRNMLPDDPIVFPIDHGVGLK